MQGDFSRLTFNQLKHYRGVLMQQGRVQLDADWNENLDILSRRIETETIDVIGQCGMPVDNAAFGVVTDVTTLSQEEQKWLTEQRFDPLKIGDFYLTKGRAYVDGILIENDNTLPFSHQPFVLPAPGAVFPGDGTFALYLDVWERLITAIEDPSIREVALGGPDTTVRSQVVWQVKYLKAREANADPNCDDELDGWPPALSDGMLCARTRPEPKPDDPCAIPPGAGYKRLENQLYRVEIHQVRNASGNPTFKWSRDNGSVVVGISEFVADPTNTKIRTTGLGRDDILGLHENDWVEVLDDATELAGQPGTLAQITKIDSDNILTLSKAVNINDLNGHPKVRRWDSVGEIDVTVPALNGGYIPLEDGLEIKFEFENKTFHTGDYWLIPARTVPGQFGDIEWPQQNSAPAKLFPFGIVHHYCKLAILEFNGEAITVKEDCRCKFPTLCDLPKVPAQGHDESEPGIHIKKIEFIDGSEFNNDTEVSVDYLAEGIFIICNAAIWPLSVKSQPTAREISRVSATVYVTLDLPYPFNNADLQLWGGEASPVVAFQPVILASDVDVKDDNYTIVWSPTQHTKDWLQGEGGLFDAMKTWKRGERILAHLTLKGNFIWGPDRSPDRYLDGEAFGVEDNDPATGLRLINAAQLPSGDHRRGGDCELWFWLTPRKPP